MRWRVRRHAKIVIIDRSCTNSQFDHVSVSLEIESETQTYGVPIYPVGANILTVRRYFLLLNLGVSATAVLTVIQYNSLGCSLPAH